MAEDAHESDALSDQEKEQAARSAPLSARVVHEVIRSEGEEELERKPMQLLLSGGAAGLSMGFSFLTQALLRAGLPHAPWSHLVASAGYTVGFAIVILGRQQLFTESTLTAVLPVLTGKGLAKVASLLRLWMWVLASNILATWAFAALLAFGEPYRPETGAALSSMAAEALSDGFAPALIKAVLAGWLIALMVWLLPSAKTARLLIIAMITYVVALAHLPHIIAGSTEAAFAVLKGQADLGAYATRFFLPTLIGNVIGGVVFVALLNHGPVSEEVREGGSKGEDGAG